MKSEKMLKRNKAFLFVLLTYAVTWAVQIPASLVKFGYSSVNIPRGVQTLSTLSPGIIAILLSYIYFGKTGIETLLKPILKCKIKFTWYLMVLFLGILLTGISLLIFDVANHELTKLEQPAFLFFYFLLILPLSALWEEIGWRGFLLPLLQKNILLYNPACSLDLFGDYGTYQYTLRLTLMEIEQ